MHMDGAPIRNWQWQRHHGFFHTAPPRSMPLSAIGKRCCDRHRPPVQPAAPQGQQQPNADHDRTDPRCRPQPQLGIRHQTADEGAERDAGIGGRHVDGGSDVHIARPMALGKLHDVERHPRGLRRPWPPCARNSQGSARFPGRTGCAGFGLKHRQNSYPMVGPRCLPISHDTPPLGTVAASCCPSRCSITGRHGTRLNPMPSSSIA